MAYLVSYRGSGWRKDVQFLLHRQGTVRFTSGEGKWISIWEALKVCLVKQNFSRILSNVLNEVEDDVANDRLTKSLSINWRESRLQELKFNPYYLCLEFTQSTPPLLCIFLKSCHRPYTIHGSFRIIDGNKRSSSWSFLPPTEGTTNKQTK